MTRTPTLFKAQVSDQTAERRFKALERYVEDLERRLRKAEGVKHLPRVADVSLSSNQTSFSSGRVDFGSATGVLVDEGIVKNATGLITVAGGRRYLVEGHTWCALTSASSDYVGFRWWNETAGAELVTDAGVEAQEMHHVSSDEHTTRWGTNGSYGFLWTPPRETTFYLDFNNNSGLSVIAEGTRILITEVAK